MATSGLSNDTRNFQCVTVASVAVIKLPLRDILASHIQPKDLFQQIQSCSTLKLRKDQLKLCCIPPPDVPDYNKFDVTLLYTLIRNLCSLPNPTQGWGNEPKANDTQISDDIERLRLFRNNYYAHAESAGISDSEFKDAWKNLKLVFRRIQPKMGYRVDYEEELVNIERTKFTDDYLTTFRVLLETFAKLEIHTDGRDEPDIFIKGENEIICGNTAQIEAEVKKVESSCWSITWQKRRGDVIKCIDTDMEKYIGSSKKKLVINSVCKEDEGEYQAVLSPELNGPEYKSKNTIRLHAVGEIPFLTISEVSSRSEGITIHFNCGVLEQSPKVHLIEWSKNGKQLDNKSNKYVGDGIDNRQLTITSPTYEDRGKYNCKVSNAVGSVSKNVMLDVPSVELLEVSPIFCGSKTTIKSVILSTPTPEIIEWQTSRDGVDFHSMKKAKHFDNTDSSFVIHKATFADKLYYRLRVWNGIGETISNKVYLNVTGSPPNIKTIPETNIKNRSVKLIGNMIIYDDSPGVKNFFWSRNYKTIDFEECDGRLSETRTDNPSLTITNVGPVDAGEYRLTAMNDVGSFTSEAIVLGAPSVSEEKVEDENNGSQRITVTIKSIPEPCHVQWSAKRKENDTFVPIDINAKEYEGTTVTLPHPVLFVKQKDQLENICFRIEVTNFIGNTQQDISGNYTTKQRKKDSVENTIYNDDGKIFEYTILSSTLVKQFPLEKLDRLKFLIKNTNKVKNLTSIKEATSVIKCIEILQDENLFTPTDVIYMQFLCQEADCFDLFTKCVEYAESKQRALCYYKKPPVNGYKDVQFHVQGDVSGYTKDYVNHVIKTVAVILRCKEEDVLLNGAQHSKSFLLSLSIKEPYVQKLLALEMKDRLKLRKLNIDYLIIDGEILDIEIPKETPFLNIFEATTRFEGITIQYNCGVSEHSPRVHRIEWSKNGQPLQHDSKKYVGGGIDESCLTITSPTNEDKGNYSCKVTNAVGSVSKDIMLDVASVQISVDSQVCCGSDTTITSVVSSIPTPEKIEWQSSKDGIDFSCISKPEFFEIDDTFTCPFFLLPQTTFADKLYYRLLVWNGIGESVSNIVYLNITGSPPNITTSLETDVKNRSVKLMGNVVIYDNSPAILETFWTKNGEKISFDTEENCGKLLEANTDNPSLTIRNVSFGDAGKYQLTAINAVGSSTSDVIALAIPIAFVEKNEHEQNGGQRITVSIKSFPAPCLVQWSAKRKNEDIFKPIDINAEEYQGTTVSFPHPVLAVKKADMLDKLCFRLDVTNFLGKTRYEISGNISPVEPRNPDKKQRSSNQLNQRFAKSEFAAYNKQHKASSQSITACFAKSDSSANKIMENTLYRDHGASVRFTKLNSVLVREFPQEKLKHLKFLLTTSGKIKNRTSVLEAETTLDFLRILQEENLFTQENVIFMQFLCRETGCFDLYEKCIEYAEKQRALCYFEKNPVNGYVDVQFHVQGEISCYTKEYIHEVIDTVAAILDCNKEDILLNGVRHSTSFLLSLSVKGVYIWKLSTLNKRDRLKLSRLNIDCLIIENDENDLQASADSVCTNDFKDVLRCHLCDTPNTPLQCDICKLHLCKACIGKHLLAKSMKHGVVPFIVMRRARSITKCLKHTSEYCYIYCMDCDIPVCARCTSALEHQGHKCDTLEKLEIQKNILERDLQELENSIYPKYHEIASYISVQKADRNKNTRKLTATIDKHGEDLHRKVDNVIRKLKSDVNEIDTRYLYMYVLNEQENEIKKTISEITESIAYMKELLSLNEVSLVSGYKSRNSEFRIFPPKLTVSLPRFTPKKINDEQIYQQFGSLSEFSIKKEERGLAVDFHRAEYSATNRSLIDEPRIKTEINTGNDSGVHSVSCGVTDEHIWTCSCTDNIMSLFNLQGELVQSIKTKSGICPGGIAVTRSGELVYTDPKDRTVNIVKKTHLQTVIRQELWSPYGVCCTSAGDLLVALVNNDLKQTKIVRYSAVRKKQTIKYNDKGLSLFSSGSFIKHISENSNLDVCVADNGAGAVVVVNQFGNLRFTYSGVRSLFTFLTIKRSFTG